MRDCMKLLISSFLDNILYKCMMHVFINHSWFAVEWCNYSACKYVFIHSFSLCVYNDFKNLER